MITINSHKGQIIELKVAGENFHSDVNFIKKELLGRVFNPDTKFWEIPILKSNFELLKKEKTFEDGDALFNFEDGDYATFLTATKDSDLIKIEFYYDAKVVDIIKKKKDKDDKWDAEAKVWLVKPETWKAVKPLLVKYLDKIGEKYDIKV